MLNKTYNITYGSLFSFKGILLVFLLFLAFFSCKKSNDADSLQARLATGGVSYLEAGNVVALNGVKYSFTNKYVGVQVALSESAKSNDTITAVVDPSMVAQYNQVYLEKNPSFPSDAFTVSHQGVFPITSGATYSKDSMYVTINNGNQLKDSTLYLVPVTLTAKSGSKLKYSLFFIKIFITVGTLSSKIYGGNTVNGTGFNRLPTGKALSATFVNVFPDSLKWRTTLTSLFPAHDVIIQATMLTDSDLNVVMKQQGWTTNLILPVANRALTKDLSTVPLRSLLSKDSITLKLYDKASLTKSKYYLTGVKIKTYTGSLFGIPPVANDSAKAYVRFILLN